MESARTGNPFVERNLLIGRIDQIAPNDDLQSKLRASEWDLVAVDEAHKMAAHFYGSKLEKTKRYQVGEQLRDITRHFRQVRLAAPPERAWHYRIGAFWVASSRDRWGT